MRQQVLFLATLALAGCTQAPQGPGTQGRVKQLEEQVEQKRRQAAEAVAGYVPKVKGNIDDLGLPTADLLKQLAGTHLCLTPHIFAPEGEDDAVVQRCSLWYQ